MSRSRRRTPALGALLGAAIVAGCGLASDDGEPAPVATTIDSASEAASDTGPPGDSTAPSTGSGGAGDGLATCADVPAITTDVIGEAGGRNNIDPIFQGVLMTYAEQHRDAFGGLWIDREANGTVVLGFTDDPTARRSDLAARRPSPDDVPAVEPPPSITDDRPIGEWGVPFDVVEVDYTEDQLVAWIGSVSEALQRAGFAVDGAGTDIIRNRVGVFLAGPVTAGELAAMERTLVDGTDVPLDAVCIDAQLVDEAPEPIDPGTALDVIVLPDPSGGYPADTDVECNGIRFPLGALSELVPADEVDDGLRAVLDGWLSNEEGAFWPQDGWALLLDDGERAQFVNITGNDVAFVGAEMGANGWRWAGASGGGPCVVERVLADGLGRVTWELDPAYPEPDADTTELHLLATEQACASGSELGDRLLGPQVVETDDAVRIAVAAIPLTGAQNCPSNPPAPVVVELERPLGERTLLDGLVVGPLTDLVAP